MTKKVTHSKGLESPIRVGSTVQIKDGSYILTINTKTNKLLSLKYKNKSPIGKSLDDFIVVTINTPIPTKKSFTESLNYQNNYIIKNLRTQEIWFCSTINIINVDSII
ncbi:hypothetical protein [Tenacibaculum sp.]|uniref:hypothetical protein n=1 Tax=Tenacibaculum sp. TaxID=1906242 RepID=UPI003D0FAA4B